MYATGLFGVFQPEWGGPDGLETRVVQERRQAGRGVPASTTVGERKRAGARISGEYRTSKPRGTGDRSGQSEGADGEDRGLPAERNLMYLELRNK